MSSVTFPTAIGGDGSTVTDDDNATTGLRNGGWRTRFIPCFTNLVNIADYVVTYTASTTAFATPPPIGSTTPNTGAFTRVTVTGSTAPANGMYLPGTNILGFATNSSERVRIDASGNVGIGTSSPGYKLDVNGSIRLLSSTPQGSEIAVINGGTYVKTTTNWNYANLILIRNSTNTSNPRFISFQLDGDSDSSGTIGAYPAIWGIYSGTPTTGSTSSGLSAKMGLASYAGFNFYINGTQAMTLDASGNFYIGGTVGGAKLNLFGGCRFLGVETAATTYSGIGSIVSDNVSISTVGVERLRVANGGAVYVYALGTGTVYSNGGLLTNTNPSDARLKEDVEPISYGLAEVNKLNPVTFKFKNDPEEVKKLSWGFIAQEVQPIMPQLVTTFQQDDEEYLGLEINGIYTILVKAIQEIAARLEALENK